MLAEANQHQFFLREDVDDLAVVTFYEPGSEPEDLRVLRVTTGVFPVLRITPAIGRAFTPDQEVEGRDRMVILSDALWRRRFGGDPAILGQTIPLEGTRYEVVGVLAPDVTYPVGAARASDLYVPYVVPQSERVRNPDWISVYLQTIGRMKPSVSIEQARARMDQIALTLQAEHPGWNKDSLAGVRPLIDHVVGARTRSWLLMLLGAVGLLIACVNVATLQLTRVTAREREVGLRAALGAGCWRLIRQLLVENLVLSPPARSWPSWSRGGASRS